MTEAQLIDGLIYYIGLVVLLSFHEFGHAWTAWRCGDDTARLQGRVSLNPLVHIDLVGTVILPLLLIFVSPSWGRFLVGWAKPVPVNPYNLGNPRRDDLLVTLAGPAMNLALALVLMLLARVGLLIHSGDLVVLSLQWAVLSLRLCFFNLIPIPPLDGSQVMRNLTHMSYETYNQISRFGFIGVILVLQVPFVRAMIFQSTFGTLSLMARVAGVPHEVLSGLFGIA
jgi:Zn-dependent protease